MLAHIVTKKQVRKVEELCVHIHQPKYLIGTMFTKVKQIRDKTRKAADLWEAHAVKIAGEERVLAEQAIMEANTAKAKQGLYLTTKLKDFLVEWSPDRVQPFKMTVAKIMTGVSKREAALEAQLVRKQNKVVKQNRRIKQQEKAIKQQEKVRARRARPATRDVILEAGFNFDHELHKVLLAASPSALELLMAHLPEGVQIRYLEYALSVLNAGQYQKQGSRLHQSSSRQTLPCSSDLHPALTLLSASMHDFVDPGELYGEDIEAIRALEQEGLNDEECAFLDAAIDAANDKSSSGPKLPLGMCPWKTSTSDGTSKPEWNDPWGELGDDITTSDVEQELDRFLLAGNEHFENSNEFQSSRAHERSRSLRFQHAPQHMVDDSQSDSASDSEPESSESETETESEAEAEAEPNRQAAPSFKRVIAEAAAAVLYAGGSIDPRIIQTARADSVLKSEDLLEEIETAAHDMRSELGDANAVDGLPWLSELEANVLQRLDLDSFAELHRGSFLQFLALHNREAPLDWLKLGHAVGSGAGVVGQRSGSGGGGDGGSSPAEHAKMMADTGECEDERPPPIATRATVAEVIVQQAVLLAVKGSFADSSFASITRLDRAVCSSLEVGQFADLDCGHSSFTAFCAAMQNKADVHGLISGNTHRVAKLLLSVESEHLRQLADAGLKVALAECFGQPTYDALECGTLDIVKRLCLSMKQELQDKYEVKEAIGERFDTAVSDLYSSSSTAMCAAPLLCRTLLTATSSLQAADAQFQARMIQCIRNAPRLTPLRSWLQWDRLVGQEQRSLREFCLAAATASSDLVFLEERIARGGEILLVDPQPSNDKLEQAMDQADPCMVAFALLSLYKEARGTRNMSVELIRTMFVAYFRDIEASAACTFALDVLNQIPDWSCLRASIAPLITSPLAAAIGSNGRMEADMLATANESCMEVRLSILNSIAASGDVLYPSWTRGFQRMLEQDHGNNRSPSFATETAAAASMQDSTKSKVHTSSSDESLPRITQNVVNSPANVASSTGASSAEGEGRSSGDTTQKDVVGDAGVDAGVDGGGGGGVGGGVGGSGGAGGAGGAGLSIPGPQRSLAGLESTCHSIVEAIQSEFMKQQGGVRAENTRRALDRLSGDLYSDETHWILELIQNADDNGYADGCTPRITFQRERGAVVVINNEVGFEERNVRAICSIADSTKERKEGHIGRKGIGFKSAFSISDQPEIHSKGFHFSLNTKYKIVPEWVDQEDRMTCINDRTQTYIVLPLRPNLKTRVTSRLYERFETLSCRLLLFLNRLKVIVVTQEEQAGGTGMTAMDSVENGGGHVDADADQRARNSRVMSRVDHASNDGRVSMIELHDGHAEEHWLVFRRRLEKMPKLKSEDPDATEISIAVLVEDDEAGSSSQSSRDGMQQYQVFAFLPVACYGFKFIVNADFHLSSSREAVSRTSPFNEKVRDNLHLLFIDAVREAKAQEEAAAEGAAADRSGSSASSSNFRMPLWKLLQKIPLASELQLSDGFFASVATKISQALQHEECIPVEGGGWSKPLNVVYTSRERLQAIPAALLVRYLNLNYVRSDIIDFVEPKILSSIRVNPLQMGQVLSLLKKMSPDEQKAEGPEWVFKVLLLLEEMKCLKNLDLLEQVKQDMAFPLTTGDWSTLAALAPRPVFQLPQKGIDACTKEFANELSFVATPGFDRKRIIRALLQLGVKTPSKVCWDMEIKRPDPGLRPSWYESTCMM